MSVSRLTSKNVNNAIAEIPGGAQSTTEVVWDSSDGSTVGSVFGSKATAIAFGNNIYIMFGQRGAHAWSHNGDAWFSGRGPLPINQGPLGATYITAPDYVTSAAFGASKWVAVTNKGSIFTGTDQHTWTSQTSPFGGTAILKVAFGNGYFVATGVNGKWAYSTDGITWTLGSTAVFSTNDISSAVYHTGSSRWVLVGGAGILGTMDSIPTATLTSRTSTFSTTAIFDVATTGTTLMAVGNTGKTATSTDGITWTAATAVSTSTLVRVGYVSSTANWIVAKQGDNTQSWSGNNGSTWTSVTVSSTATRVAYSFGTATTPFITDGVSRVITMHRESTTAPFRNFLFTTTSTTYTTTATQFVVNMGTLTNGASGNFQVVNLGGGEFYGEHIAYGNGKLLSFFASTNSGATASFKFVESTDGGDTWYSAQIGTDPAIGSGIGGGVATGNVAANFPVFLKNINGYWFMGDNLSNLYTSLDGINWLTEITMASRVIGIEFADNTWIAFNGTSTSSTSIANAVWRTKGNPCRIIPGAYGSANATTWTVVASLSVVNGGAASKRIKFIKYASGSWNILMTGTVAGELTYRSFDGMLTMNAITHNGTTSIGAAVGFDFSSDGYFMLTTAATATLTPGIYISQDFANWYLLNGTASGTANDVLPASSVNLMPGILQTFDGVFYLAADGHSQQRGVQGTGSIIFSTNAVQTITNARGNFTGGLANSVSQLSKYIRTGNNFFGQYCSSGVSVNPGYGGATGLVDRPFGIGRTPVVETVKL